MLLDAAVVDLSCLRKNSLGVSRPLIADLPNYGLRYVGAHLRRQVRNDGQSAPNAERVYR